jgi:flavodoxin I
MTIPFIYASASGNVEATMENIAFQISKLVVETPLYKVEKTPFDVVKDNSIMVFGTSTWDHGTLNPFWNNMLVEIGKNSMAGKKVAFVGLGDIRYESLYFCRGIDTLRDAFVAAGGVQLGMTLKINGDPFSQFDKIVAIWSAKLTEIIQTELKEGR